MHVLFEDDGDLKAGTVRSATEASLQVDSTSGKRVKVKAAAVVLRFEHPRAEELLTQAQAASSGIETDFLWQCAPQQEFGFEELAAEYFGRTPGPVEAAAILIRLQSAPVYFQRKGRGRFRPATPEVLRVALAAVERRRRQDEQRAAMVQDLIAGRLPKPIADLGAEVLISADRNSIEYKAVDQAAHELHLSPLRLLLARGAIASPYDWHLRSFLARAFARGTGFAADLPQPGPMPDGLPMARAQVFTIDDSATTEIDDGFSVHEEGGRVQVGIHIAVPALGIAAGTPMDLAARARMSTVYAPGLKITMLPDPWIDAFSLAEGRTVPALSLYLEIDPNSLEIRGTRSALETVRVAANLRHDRLEAAASEESLERADAALPFASELRTLWRFTGALRASRERARGRPEPKGREEISIVLDGTGADARVRLQVRRRDAPLDRIVAELMIRANSHWGSWLEELGRVGIYRSQSQGRVRMSTSPGPHEGLGVANYAWCTSPLRRYVDLVNQRQLVAAVRGAPPPHRRGDSDLYAAVSAFDAAYASYAEFQDLLERYWSLRWLQQEGVRRIEARVARGDIVRVQGLPLTVRLAGAASHERGRRLELEIGDVDLVELVPEARILRVFPPEADGEPEADPELDPEGESGGAPTAGAVEPVAAPAAPTG